MPAKKSQTVHRLHITEIDKFLKKFVPSLRGGEVLALFGDLGAGKTTLTQKLGKLIGVKKRITSPTYILLQEFETQLKTGKAKQPITLYHLDLYRTTGFTETKTLGLPEFWGKENTLTIIEWADKIEDHLPVGHTIKIYLV